MKKTFSFLAAALLLASCGKQGPLQVTVSNPFFARTCAYSSKFLALLAGCQA